MKKTLLIFVFILISFYPKHTKAVMPPDFIFSMGSQIIQVGSMLLLMVSTALGFVYQALKDRLFFLKIKNKKLFFGVTVLLIISVSFGGSWLYANYKQRNEYQKWLKKSQELLFGDNAGNSINLLDINNQKPEFTPEEKIFNFVDRTNQEIQDPTALFIRQYYHYIADGKLEQAYNMTSQPVSLESYKSWYQATTKIMLDKMIRIDKHKTSLELTLYEDNIFTRYGVLMTLNFKDNTPINIASSEVKLLASVNILADEEKSSQAGIDMSDLSVSNEEFDKVINFSDDYLVLDARENIEYENGHFPDSLHIRFADLKAGEWLTLPNDKYIYVICWSGIRGEEVAKFLRTKNFLAKYLKTGANGWFGYGGLWEGNIKFADKYSEDRYRLVFSTEEVKKALSEGVRLVDSREPWLFEKNHIPGSVNIPIMYTPSLKLEEAFSQVQDKSKVIIICDGYVNCFDAKLTGVELEKRGHEFLGRYNKPWEY